MNAQDVRFDLVVIGGGPAGQQAALQGARAGCSVLLVERGAIGGACVHHGTIPSKTMREAALALDGFRRRTGGLFQVAVRQDLQVRSLLRRVDEVVGAHERYMAAQLERGGVICWQGVARFVTPHRVAVQDVHGEERHAAARFIVIASGSRPRTPAEFPIDHEHVLDSDSILSLIYLPATLAVLGAGVIACEYASIFSALGVKVVLIDRGDRPLGFLDPELTGRFVDALSAMGGRYLGQSAVREVAWDGLSQVVTTLGDGQVIRSEKMLVALGRQANIEGMDLPAAGLRQSERGLLQVDEHCRTAAPHIYAAGDVIGPPALASSAMEQGRRAVCHALGLPPGPPLETYPIGVYTVPEMASVGLGEAQAIERHGGALVGRAPFQELARGQIAAIPEGLLKMVADPQGRRLLGVQIIGEGAAELIHLGQMALLHGGGIDAFVENVFNFPTLAEAYRVAALDIVYRRPIRA